MKKIVLVITMITYNVVFSQLGNVGINTENPTRKLDINGNLRIRNLQNVSENANYSNVLVSDEQGNVDHVLRSDLIPKPDEFTSDKIVINNLYTNETGTADPLKIITCGKFRFRFIHNTSENKPAIQFGINEQPSSPINVYISMEQNWSSNGFQFFQGTASGNTNPFVVSNAISPVITNGEITDYSNFVSFAEAQLADYEQNVIHFQYPKEKDLYRLTVYKVPYTITNTEGTTTTKHDFISACEKF